MGIRLPARAGMPATQTAGKKPAPYTFREHPNARTFELSNGFLGRGQDPSGVMPVGVMVRMTPEATVTVRSISRSGVRTITR